MNSTLTIERILANRGEDEKKVQETLDKFQRVDWIQGMGPWELMMTGTFRWCASRDSASRTFTRWIRRHYNRVSYFMCVEEHGMGHGFHVHSLWADAQSVYRREAWHSWFGKYGRFRLEPVRSPSDASDYASKYLCKPNAWWDFSLQWHRRQRINGALSIGEHPPRPAFQLQVDTEAPALPVLEAKSSIPQDQCFSRDAGGQTR